MNYGFRTDNDTLAGRAGAFAGLAERAARIATDLDGRLNAVGECWGADAAGRAFADCHVAPAAAALQSVNGLPAGLLDVGVRLSVTAVCYADSEQASDAAVRSAGLGLD